MRIFKELRETCNSYVYNKLHKQNLERIKKIVCSHCPYHRWENDTSKWYGTNDYENLRYPSWKLATNNRKQWMLKNLKFDNSISRFGRNKFIEIHFKKSSY